MGKGDPFKAITSFLGGGTQKIKVQKPNIAKPRLPKEYDKSYFKGEGNKILGLMSPESLHMPAGMTGLQARTNIATQAVGGGGGAFSGGDALKYYRDLAFKDYSGGTLSPTEIEKQYVGEILGEKIMGGSTENYLSALERAYRRTLKG